MLTVGCGGGRADRRCLPRERASRAVGQTLPAPGPDPLRTAPLGSSAPARAHNASPVPARLSRAPTPKLQRGANRRDAARELVGKWPAVLLEHPAVCEDPAVVLRLLATSHALGDEAAAAACGRLRVTLRCKGEYDYRPPGKNSPEDRARRALCREQAALVERRGALLAELVVSDGSAWRNPHCTDHWDRPIEGVLAPALRRAAAAGRLTGLRAFEAPGFRLEGGLLRALALCPALTRLRLGTFDIDRGSEDEFDPYLSVHVGDRRPSVSQLRAVARQLAALRGLRELDLAFGCERAPAPALAGLSALTRLTRLRLGLAGLWHTVPPCDIELFAATREWSGLHALPASLLDLTLVASAEVRGAFVWANLLLCCLGWLCVPQTWLACLVFGRLGRAQGRLRPIHPPVPAWGREAIRHTAAVQPPPPPFRALACPRSASVTTRLSSTTSLRPSSPGC
jgi:hypothetical protein